MLREDKGGGYSRGGKHGKYLGLRQKKKKKIGESGTGRRGIS